jgi:putative peptidoglycan lipid II flippase
MGVYFVDVMVGRRMLSELDEGSVTYFSYAMRLCDFSQGIFVMALSSATLPSLATFVGRGELDEVAKTLAFSLRLALFVGLGAAVGSVMLAQPIVSAVFEHGHFSDADAHETSRAFVAQGVGIFLVAGVRQLVIVFFALGKTSIPVYVAMIDLVVFFLLGMGLRQEFGHVGVSLAVTGARITQFALLWLALRRYLPRMHTGEVLRSFSKSAFAALVAGGAAWGFLAVLPEALTRDSPWRHATTGIAGTLFLATFFLAAQLARSEELKTTLGPILRRLRAP